MIFSEFFFLFCLKFVHQKILCNIFFWSKVLAFQFISFVLYVGNINYYDEAKTKISSNNKIEIGFYLLILGKLQYSKIDLSYPIIYPLCYSFKIQTNLSKNYFKNVVMFVKTYVMLVNGWGSLKLTPDLIMSDPNPCRRMWSNATLCKRSERERKRKCLFCSTNLKTHFSTKKILSILSFLL